MTILLKCCFRLLSVVSTRNWFVLIEGLASVENLKLCRSVGWHFLTRLKENRNIQVKGGSLQAVSQAGLCGGNGTVVWLKDFGQIKVFCVRAIDGTAEYWAASLK